MVFSSVVLLAAANLSADVSQYLACYPERVSNQQLLELLFCLPLQRLGRLALCLWSFFCFPPSTTSYYMHSSDDSDSDSDSSASDYDVDDSRSD